MPSRSSAFALLAVLLGAATPASAEIFLISRGNNSILVFADDATGNVAPLRRIQGPATQIGTSGNLNGIAVDVEHAEIFVSLATARVLVFDMAADGNVAPLRTLSGPATGLGFSAGVAVDPVYDELWVANPSSNALHVFARQASGNTAPLRTIQGGATGIQQPTGIFVDLDADEVYLTNEASAAAGVNVFARLADGNVAPVRQLIGPATTFGFATGVFRNPSTGELLVADLFTARVLTFPDGADGNVPPASTLSSGALSSTAGLTLTHVDELLVVDLFGNGVRGFDVGASGTTAPSRNLGGPATQISTPIYIATTDGPFAGAVFTSAPDASFATRNAGTNPASYTVSAAPSLGSTFELAIDVAATGGTSGVIVVSVAPANLPVPSGNVLLVSFPPTLLLGPKAGSPVSFSVTLPLDLSLAGITIFTQGAHLSTSPGFVLSNAVDLTLGL